VASAALVLVEERAQSFFLRVHFVEQCRAGLELGPLKFGQIGEWRARFTEDQDFRRFTAARREEDGYDDYAALEDLAMSHLLVCVTFFVIRMYPP
jgi:hypothetical protein